jgi:hypothetical protein
MPIIVFCGGRKFNDLEAVERELLAFCTDGKPDPDITIMHGGAPGADRLVDRVARQLGFHVTPVPARWTDPCRDTCAKGHRRARADGVSYCPAAGVYRNQLMLEADPLMVIGLPGGKGTRDMLSRTRRAGVEWAAPGWEPFGKNS